MTEIAKALSENAKILILDEPTSALAEAEIDKLMEILRDAEGARRHLHLHHPQTGGVLPHHRYRSPSCATAKWSPPSRPTDLTPEKLVSYMVGREMKERFPKGNRKPGEVILEVEDLHALDPEPIDREVLKGVSFNLRKGEILGIAGLMGSGRTELVMTIFGEYAKITQGKIKLEGREITISNSARGHAARHQPGAGRPQTARTGADPIDPEEHLAAQPGSVRLLHADQSTTPKWTRACDIAKEPGDQGAQPARAVRIPFPAATSRRWSSPNG